jgi:hypothetical protein
MLDAIAFGTGHQPVAEQGNTNTFHAEGIVHVAFY